MSLPDRTCRAPQREPAGSAD